MNKEELIIMLIEALGNAKTIDDVKAVFFMMLEQKLSADDMIVILKDMKLRADILERINESEGIVRKKQVKI